VSISVSVIIPTYNRAADLRHCLEALAAQTLSPDRYEVLVIDDGSSDETPAVVAEAQLTACHDLRSFVQPNRGPGAARNQGIRHASGEVIAFTDDDCRPDRDWLEALLTALPADPRIAGIGGRTVRLRDTLVSRYIDAIGMLHHPRKQGSVLWLVTANALYRRSSLSEVGGFEEQFGWPGGEDVELSARIRAKEYSLTTTEKAIVHHNHRDSLRGLYRTCVRYGRGEAIQVKLGRKSGFYHRWLAIFLVCVIGHFVLEATKLLIRPDLRLVDRLAFPWLRLMCNVGIFVGYASERWRGRGRDEGVAAQ